MRHDGRAAVSTALHHEPRRWYGRHNEAHQDADCPHHCLDALLRGDDDAADTGALKREPVLTDGIRI